MIDVPHLAIPLFSGIVAGYVTPLIMGAWGKLSPPAESSPHDRWSEAELQRRNKRINTVASALSVTGILIPVALYLLGASRHNPWPLGLGFGLMVILPVSFIALATLPQGKRRYGEFWRFYELEYGIGLKSLAVFYVLLGLLGLVSAYKLIF